jgi:flagellar assembly protein FliH
MRNQSRFISGEKIDAVAQWNFDAVDTAAILLAAQARERERTENAAREETIRQTAFAEGVEAGRIQAMPEVQRQIDAFINSQGQEMGRQLAGVIESAREQLVEAEKVAAQSTLELACALARQVLRHELSSNPNVLLPVIREGLATLFSDSQNIVVRMNPLDWDMLQDTLRSEFPGLALAFRAEPAITAGGCLIESAGTVIDGTVETRWARAVGRLGLDFPWEEARDGA